MKPQLALHLYKEEEKKNPKLDDEYIIFQKYDGWYGYFDFGVEGIFSRAGRRIPSLDHLAKVIKLAADDAGIDQGRLIFEILVEGAPEFHELNGILNRKSEQAKGAYLMVHDLVGPLDETTVDRLFEAVLVVDLLALDAVRFAKPLCTTSYIPRIKTVCNHLWSLGCEGIIGKAAQSYYQPGKRNSSLIKIKEECTAELLVTGMLAGDKSGKYHSTLGTLTCVDKAGVVHNISGMSDEQRDKWYLELEPIVGKVIEIKAMKKLPDGTYREPRFKAIRHDKAGINDCD